MASRIPRTTVGFAAFLLSAALVTGAFATPGVTLTPKIGPPTTSITVKGSGFAASAPVDIYFDTTDLCLAIATAGGAINCTIKTPADAAPQAHYVTAVQRSPVVGAQAAFTIRTDWAQFHGMNAKHNGYNPYENTINTQNVRKLDTLWAAQLDLDTESTPVVVSGRIYIGTFGGLLYSFASKTGALINGWPVTLGGSTSSSPVVGNNIVYIGTNAPDSKLYAFNAVTGAAIGGFPVTVGDATHGMSSAPTLYGNNVYAASEDGNIYAFHAANGTTVAGFPVSAGGNTNDGTVSAAQGWIFEGATNNHIYFLDAATGITMLDDCCVGGAIESTIAIASGQLFFGVDDGSVYGLHRSTGSPLSGYAVSTGGAVTGSPAVGDARAIVGSADQKLYSFWTSGGTNWATPLDNPGNGSPVIANGVVYANTLKSLYALDESNGAILWRGSVRTNGKASPIVVDGVVYIGSFDRNLYAFSVNGVLPSSLLPGGEKGIRPAISSLKPDYSLKLRN